MRHLSLMIPGAVEEGDGILVRSPYDGAELAHVATGGDAAVEAALRNACTVFADRSRWISAMERIAILERTVQAMAAEAESLALQAASEGGKPLVDSRVEVARAIDSVKSCVEHLRTQHGEEVPMDLNTASADRLAVSRLFPIGPVVAVSAFNHPLNLIVHQVAPAIIVGCPVIVKPAVDTPLSCIRFVQLLRAAGLPEAWCQVLVTDRNETAQRLVTDPRVAFLSFIGSSRVGWMLRSQLAPGVRCALEHGGAAPVIVAADADLDRAVPLIAKGGFYHAGQVCVSVQRVFVHRQLVDEFSARLAAIARILRVGDPTQPETEVGPLIRPAEIERVETWVSEAVDGGARLLSGGTRLGASCFACTVLLDPPASARVSREEIFGPVVCVYSYDDLEEAFDRANDVPSSFQAAVFSRDIDVALRAYARLNASAVMVNDHPAFRVDWMPFAGLRGSGLGVGGIPHTMADMQIRKMLVVHSPGR
jgi:acyl-CoA reductase-like NAD-dependent aldehyde dehydrogenase